MFIALLSALSWSGNMLIDKFALSKRKIPLNNYVPLVFVFLFILTFITLPWLGGVNAVLAASRNYIFYLVLMILLAIMWNIFYYQGLQRERMVEFEMILMVTPLATILLDAFFFPEEFRLPVFLAAVVGGSVLLLSHLRKHHFEFDKYAIHLLLAVFLMAMEAMVQKELLAVYSPALLYAIRTAMVAFFFTIYYRPKIEEMHDFDFRLAFSSSALGAFYMVARFYGYELIGVTFTTLITLLAPVIASWFDAQMNHRRIKRRTIIAFMVILACVVYATLQQQL